MENAAENSLGKMMLVNSNFNRPSHSEVLCEGLLK